METELRDLLFTAVKAYADGESLLVRWPNKPTPALISAAQIYLAPTTFPVPPELFTVCDASSKHKWVCQISVYARDGIGEALAAQHVDQITPLFRAGTKLIGANHTFTIVVSASPAPSIPLDGWLSTPVHFRVQTIH